jgi:hypothetical protein
MMRALAKYDGGDIVAEFEASAMFEPSEIVGRPGEWVAGDDVEITSLEILGCDVDPAELPPDLVAAIYDLSDDLEWRFEREDVE